MHVSYPINASELADESQCPDNNPLPVVWFEVEDFLRYFDHFRNPTGLQRVPFEIYLEAERLYGNTKRIRFCRLSLYTKQLRTITFERILSAYSNPPGARAPWETLWAPAKLLNNFLSAVPEIIRHPGFFYSILKVAVHDIISVRFRRYQLLPLVRPGDVIVSLGAGWGIPHCIEHIAKAKRRYGIKFAILIHDLIPIEYETFVERQHVIQFRSWLEDAIPLADMVLTISRHSRDTLIRLADANGWSLPHIEVVEPGSGLNDRLNALAQTTTRFPPHYVLFVSTIEIRKNHRLLVRVWRRLLERYGRDAIPMLIFAGKIGWSVDDLLAELRASNYLDNKIILVSDLTDAELCECYRSCMFTVFPSLCEGWGLPVAESLAQGKCCVASNRTSIPEVGGNLIDYFDPSNDDEAYAKIERLIIDPDYLKAREAQLRAEYRPRTWADCVRALVGKFQPNDAI